MRADRPLLTDRKSAAAIPGLEQQDAAAGEAWYGRVDLGQLRAALGKLRSKAASR